MPIRIYVAPQIGSGTREDPYRSIIRNFIDVTQGDRYDEIDNPRTRTSVCTVYARQEVHDALYADREANPGRIVYLLPLSDTDDDKRANLAVPWTSIPEQFRERVTSILAAAGCGEVPEGATLQDVLRMLCEAYQPGLSGKTFLFAGGERF
jgi:hypothetical protein